MKFEYYVLEQVNRLFRYVEKTGQQDRWSEEDSEWVSVGPGLEEWVQSGRTELDLVTEQEAKKKYPSAFSSTKSKK